MSNKSLIYQLFILVTYSGYFYTAFSSPLLLRGVPETARILCRCFTPKRHRQLRVKDLPKLLTWRLERNSNQRPFGPDERRNLPMSHHVPLTKQNADRNPYVH